MPLTISELYWEDGHESDPDPNADLIQVPEYRDASRPLRERIIVKIYEGGDTSIPIVQPDGQARVVDVVAPEDGPFSYAFYRGPKDMAVGYERIEEALADPEALNSLKAVMLPGEKHSVEGSEEPVVEGYVIRSHEIIQHYIERAAKVVSSDQLLDNLPEDERSGLVRHVASVMTTMNAGLMLEEPYETYDETVDYEYGNGRIKRLFVLGIRKAKKVRFEIGVYDEEAEFVEEADA